MRKTPVSVEIAVLVRWRRSLRRREPGRGSSGRGSGGPGMGTPYGRMYDARALETISGQVVTVERITPMRGMSADIHAVLKGDAEKCPRISGRAESTRLE